MVHVHVHVGLSVEQDQTRLVVRAEVSNSHVRVLEVSQYQ